jgi:hypothetical protein
MVRKAITRFTATRALGALVLPVAGLSFAAASASGSFASAAPAASCSACGHNLIQNPGAEAGKGSKEDTKVPVPDWTAVGNFTAASYHWTESDITTHTPGPKAHGKNYFYGGPEGKKATTGTQLITVPAAGISSGKVRYKLSGWLGGYSSQRDNAVLTASFETASGKVLSTATIGPVTPGQRKDVSELVHRATSGKVPAHTKRVSVVLTMTRHDASDNDGMADNLSLVFTG